jgi:hypothetical protein
MRLPNDSHPNVEAGAYVAERLAAKFVELGLMPPEQIGSITELNGGHPTAFAAHELSIADMTQSCRN